MGTSFQQHVLVIVLVPGPGRRDDHPGAGAHPQRQPQVQPAALPRDPRGKGPLRQRAGLQAAGKEGRDSNGKLGNFNGNSKTIQE